MFEAVADAWLAITIYTWLSVEILSAFEKWNKWTVLAAWLTICVVFGIIFIKNHIWERIKKQAYDENGIINRVTGYKGYIITWFIFVLFVSLTALLRGQNLIDNLTHRLPRIMHWIQNESVKYFATSSERQVQLSSLVEYMNAQVYLLGGCDRLIKLVQVGAYVCSGIMIFGISRKLGVNYKLSFVSSWIYSLIPMAIIETYTTQTDTVAALYLLIFVYLILDFIRTDNLVMNKRGVFSAIRLSACVLAGYLSKPTVCFIMLVFFLWMCIIRLWKKDKLTELFKYAIVGGITAAILFSPSYIRNYQAYKVEVSSLEEINSVQEKEDDSVAENIAVEKAAEPVEANQRLVVNSLRSPKRFIMSCVQNLGMNASTRYFSQFNQLIFKVVYKCADIVNYTFPPEGDFWILADGGGIGETSEPSPAIMLFWAFTCVIVILGVSRLNKEQRIYLLCATAGMIVQSGLMGYTYYRTRYLLGAMGVLCPIFVATIQEMRVTEDIKQKIATTLVVISAFGAVNALSYEIPYAIDGLKGEKIHQYFVNNNEPEFYYDQMSRFANENEYTKVGIAGTIQYEYALWQTIDNLERLEMVNVEDSVLSKYEDREYIPECIFEESEEEIKLGDELACHGVKYECVWADFGNNRYYTAFTPCK